MTETLQGAFERREPRSMPESDTTWLWPNVRVNHAEDSDRRTVSPSANRHLSPSRSRAPRSTISPRWLASRLVIENEKDASQRSLQPTLRNTTTREMSDSRAWMLSLSRSRLRLRLDAMVEHVGKLGRLRTFRCEGPPVSKRLTTSTQLRSTWYRVRFERSRGEVPRTTPHRRFQPRTRLPDRSLTPLSRPNPGWVETQTVVPPPGLTRIRSRQRAHPTPIQGAFRRRRPREQKVIMRPSVMPIPRLCRLWVDIQHFVTTSNPHP